MYLYITLDTTGLCSVTDEIISINVIIGKSAKQLSTKSSKSFKIRPKKDVPDNILKYIGATREEIDSYPDATETFVAFQEYLKKYSLNGEDKLKVVCYNSEFIYKFLSEFFNTYSFEPPKEDRYSSLFNYLDIRGVDVIDVAPFIELVGGIQLKDYRVGSIAKTLGVDTSDKLLMLINLILKYKEIGGSN